MEMIPDSNAYGAEWLRSRSELRKNRMDMYVFYPEISENIAYHLNPPSGRNAYTSGRLSSSAFRSVRIEKYYRGKREETYGSSRSRMEYVARSFLFLYPDKIIRRVKWRKMEEVNSRKRWYDPKNIWAIHVNGPS